MDCTEWSSVRVAVCLTDRNCEDYGALLQVSQGLIKSLFDIGIAVC